MPLKINNTMKYSVVIITADRHKLLKNCLDKLFEYGVDKKAEIVVVDAGEDDFLYDKKDYIKYIKIPVEEKGFSNQRNTGVKNSSGDYIIFIDDDIEIREGWFEDFTSEFEKYPDKLGAMGAVFPKQNNIISFITGVMGHPGGGFKMHSVSEGSNIPISYFATCNTVIKKDVIETVGYFNLAVKYGSEDSDLSVRIIKKYGNEQFLYIPSAFVWHYSPENLSRFIRWYTRRGLSDAELLLLYKEHKKYFFRTMFLIKLLVLLFISIFAGFKVILIAGIIWYLWILFKYRFMFKYFPIYKFSLISKIFIFFSFPFFRALADLFFDYGRLKRVYENFIYRYTS